MLLRHARRATLAVACVFSALFSMHAPAAEIGSGTLTPTNRLITPPGRTYKVPNPTGALQQICNAKLVCDYYSLTVSLPATYVAAHPSDKVRISASWATHAANADFDLTLFDQAGNDLSGTEGASSSDPEVIERTVQAGTVTYRLRVVPYYLRPDRGETVFLRFELVDGAPVSNSTVQLGGPTFENYVHESDVDFAQEPTLDVNLNTDHALMLFGTIVQKVVWDDTTSPPAATWTDVSDLPGAISPSADPLMTGDQFKLPSGKYSSRMFVAQLLSATSHVYWSDDEGATWTHSQGGGQPHGVDNESMAAGPYPKGYGPLKIPTSYGHALYYCSHSEVQAFCSRSDDGGLTWLPSKPIFPATADCSNHGHVKVGIDGTVYVPMNNSCEGAEGVSVSVDAGQTWTWIKVPNTVQGRWDSSIGIANDGKTLYYAYGETGTDRPMILKGFLDKTNPSVPAIRWQLPAIDVGVPAGLKNIVFNTVVAGDPDRAAYAFHGTTTPGDSNDATLMAHAEWHLYVSTTFDGGKTWNLRDVTPTDPTQRGAICHGTVCTADTSRPPDRNLLDFMDMVADSKGRLLIGYADGCTGDCALPGGAPNYTQVGVIARQVSGKRMYAAFDNDGAGGVVPGIPVLSGTRNEANVILNWTQPSTGSSPILSYSVKRSVNHGVFSQIATTTLAKYTDDTAVNPNATYTYQVAATNAAGTGQYSAALTPVRLTEDACQTPGLTILNDAEGDILQIVAPVGSPLPQQLDLLKLSVAQPDDTAGGYRFTFTLRVKDLSAIPTDAFWPVQFQTGTNDIWEVRMTTAHELGATAPVFQLRKKNVLVPGAVVAGSHTTAGEIKMTVRASDLGLSSPGTDVINAFLSRVSVVIPMAGTVFAVTPDGVPTVGAITPDNMPDDVAPAGKFVSLPTRACAPNAAPIASMFLSPNSGARPLTVTFNASASSDADAGDTVARYVFEFGDGSVVSSTAPIVTHTYSTIGIYGTSLRVVDSRGKPSANFDGGQVVVQ